MTDPIQISVVIPAYNVAHFLPRCLASVSAQTLPPAEIIVVDDGSTDDSASVARGLGAKVVSKANGGLSSARNAGIRAASTNWIALLDADDRWAPEKLRLQAAAVSGDTVLVYTGIRIFDDTGVRSTSTAASPAAAKRMLRYCNPIAPSTVLARRDCLERVGGFREDIRACEDWDMWVRLQRMGSFAAVEQSVTDYYVHPASMSADPARMLVAFEQISDATLLADLRGPERWVWRRRLHAAQFYSASLIARDNHVKGEVRYILRSLGAWPSPAWQPRRFLSLIVSLKNMLSSRHSQSSTRP